MTSIEHSIMTNIIGGGIGGITLANMLSLGGEKYEVYERNAEIYGDGFGLNIQPAAVAVLYHLGLKEKLDITGIRTRAHRYINHRGEVLYEEARGLAAGFEFPQISIHRNDLLKLLYNNLPISARIQFGCEIDERKLEQKINNGISNQKQAQLTVGADGLHSVVRRYLFPKAQELNTSETILWRGITAMPRLLDGKTMILANDKSGIRLIAYPVSNEYEINNESLVNWVILIPRNFPRGNKNLDDNNEQVSNYLLNCIGDWNFGWLDLELLIKSSKKYLKTEMVDRDPLDIWSSRNCVLIGDAAHPMFPVGANGATQSIIDAGTLAKEIIKGTNIENVIKNYESLRVPIVRNIVLANREMNSRELSSKSLDDQEFTQNIIETTKDYRSKVINSAIN